MADLSAYNTWANLEISRWLITVNPELLTAATPSSFPTIDQTLQHMLRTQKFWLLFVTSQSLSGFSWAVRTEKPLLIMEELNHQSAEMERIFCSFTESELEVVLHLSMPWAQNQLPRFHYLMHVLNHSTFHRGQIITMARQLGITEGIPATDYNIYKCL